ncbi:10848_t:CDS:2 [Dentiscutata erythropus]|uniref:10848_t:CDS:1 n=1 Tax=Dentiscutata erythropus TaxID=1348616 RepID=A0A9N9CXP8_9GLOM|nr:10848_t:CDS:2 [Dentiscutata erythropus]
MAQTLLKHILIDKAEGLNEAIKEFIRKYNSTTNCSRKQSNEINRIQTKLKCDKINLIKEITYLE